MRTTHILYFLLGILLGVSCSEDKGNYSYTPVNDVIISGIQDKDYIFVLNDTLKIPVTLSRSLESTEANLSFLWEFEDQAVATTKDLCIQSPKGVSFGKKKCRFTVTDNSNGTNWYKTFTVNVVSAFNWGYYFLTEKEDHSTVVSYLPISDSTEQKNLLHTSSIEGIEMGKYPVKILGSYDYGEDYYQTYILSKEGEFPAMLTNTGTFSFLGGVNARNFIDQTSHYPFAPTNLIVDPRTNMYLVSEGKFVAYIGGVLYRPSKHRKDYYWTYSLSWPQMVSCALALDKNSQKFYYIATQPSIPNEGIIGDPYALDKVVEFENSPTFTNEVIAGNVGSYSYAADYTAMESNITIISCTNGQFHFNKYAYHADYKTGIERAEFQGRVDISVNGANNNSKAIVAGTNCYFTAGNQIFTSPNVQLQAITPFKDIPAGFGDIVEIAATAGGSRLLVTTYAPQSTEEMKGSLFVIDIQTKEILYSYKHKMHKCVSILSANTDPQGWGNGDGK